MILSQDDVAELLKKEKNKWFGSREIANHLGIGMSSVSHNLRGLIKRNVLDINHIPKIKYKYKE